MIAVTEDMVREIAQAAAITLTPEESAHMLRDMQEIVQFVERLKAVDTEGVQPTIHPVALVLAMRDDVPAQGHPREALLALAPDAEGGYFRVPSVLGE